MAELYGVPPSELKSKRVPMTKIIEDNALKIINTVLVIIIITFTALYVRTLETSIVTLQSNIVEVNSATNNSYQSLMEAINFLNNRITFTNKILTVSNQIQISTIKHLEDTARAVLALNYDKRKPTYDELKNHNVFIVGCTGTTIPEGVSLIMPDEDVGCWTGTGVVVKVTKTSTYILTNNHVAGKGEKKVHLYVENGTGRVEATVFAYNKSVDAAVLRVNVPLIGKTPIKKIADVKIQDSVYVVGNPLSQKNIYTEGVIAGYKHADIMVQMPCIYGNSGSGVFDRDGNLVGLVYALEMYRGEFTLESRITHTLMVHTNDIRSFLQELNLYEKKR